MIFKHCTFVFVSGMGGLPVILIILVAAGVIPFSPLMLAPLAVPAVIGALNAIVHSRLPGPRKLASWEREDYYDEYGRAPRYAPPPSITIESDDLFTPEDRHHFSGR